MKHPPVHQMQQKLLGYIKLFTGLALCMLLFLILQIASYQSASMRLRSDFIEQQYIHFTYGAKDLQRDYTRYRITQLPAIQNIGALQKLQGRKLTPTSFAHMIAVRDDLAAVVGGRISDPFTLLVFDGEGEVEVVISPTTIYHDFSRSTSSDTLSIAGLQGRELVDFLGTAESSKRAIPRFLIADVSRGKKTSPNLMMVQRLNAASVYALWLYDVDALHATLSNGSRTTSFLTLTDQEGLVYTTDPEVDTASFTDRFTYVKEEGLTYFRVTMNSIGLTAYLALDDQEIVSHLKSFVLLQNVLLVLFCVLALISIVLILVYIYRPFDRLYDQLSAHMGDMLPARSGILNAMEDGLAELIKNQRTLEQAMQKNLLTQLLESSTLSPSTIESLSHLSRQMQGKAFRIVLVGCPPEKQGTFHRLRGKIEEALSGMGLSLYTWVDEDVAALALSDSASQLLRTLLESLYQQISGLMGPANALIFAVGREHAQLRGLRESFQEAEDVFLKARQSTGIFFYEAPPSVKQFSEPSYEDLGRLYSLLDNGRCEEAVAHLDQLAAQLSDGSAPMLPRELTVQFAQEVRGVALRLSLRWNEPSLAAAFPESPCGLVSLQEWLESAHEAFRQICRFVQGAQENEPLFSRQLMEYLQEYYRDSAMSLTTLAEAFSMSERSLQRYFSERLQDTFTNVLEHYRIGEAEQLLLSGNYTAAQIAERVGYANTSTFSKAFKRRHGMTPTEWKRKKGGARH